MGSVAFGWTSRPGTAGIAVGMLAELGFSVFVVSPLVRLRCWQPHPNHCLDRLASSATRTEIDLLQALED